MKIVPRTFHDGKVQSLRYQTAEGKDCSVGVVLPGTYFFPVHKRKELMYVTGGKLTINGKEYVEGGIPFEINAGDEFTIVAEIPSSYIAHFPE